MPYGYGRQACWGAGYRRGLQAVSFPLCFSFLLLFFFSPPPSELGQYKRVVKSMLRSCFFSRWFLFCVVMLGFHVVIFLIPSSFVSVAAWLSLPLTKIGKLMSDSLLSAGQRDLESYVLMGFLFELFSFITALQAQAFQEHSAVWDVILIRNTVENSTLPLEKNPAYLPPWVISQASFL